MGMSKKFRLTDNCSNSELFPWLDQSKLVSSPHTIICKTKQEYAQGRLNSLVNKIKEKILPARTMDEIVDNMLSLSDEEGSSYFGGKYLLEVYHQTYEERIKAIMSAEFTSGQGELIGIAVTSGVSDLVKMISITTTVECASDAYRKGPSAVLFVGKTFRGNGKEIGKLTGFIGDLCSISELEKELGNKQRYAKYKINNERCPYNIDRCTLYLVNEGCSDELYVIPIGTSRTLDGGSLYLLRVNK